MKNQLYLSLKKVNNNSCFSLIFIILINIFYASNGWAYHGTILNSLVILAFLFGFIDILMHRDFLYRIFFEP